MKSHETAFHVINCHVPVCHAVVPSRKWTMWLFRYVIVISYKCSITSTEVAPSWPRCQCWCAPSNRALGSEWDFTAGVDILRITDIPHFLKSKWTRGCLEGSIVRRVSCGDGGFHRAHIFPLTHQCQSLQVGAGITSYFQHCRVVGWASHITLESLLRDPSPLEPSRGTGAP